MWECPLLLPLPTAGPPSADLTSHQGGRSLQVGLVGSQGKTLLLLLR